MSSYQTQQELRPSAPVSERTLILALLVVLSFILYAGLTPFRFYPPNRVQWLEPGPGLRFDRPAIAYTASPFAWPASQLAKGISIELWVLPNDEPKYRPREIASFFDGHLPARLTIAQWKAGLIVNTRREKIVDNARDVWVSGEETLLPRGRKQFLTLTSSPDSITLLYANGQPVQRTSKRQILLRDEGFSGQLVLGARPNGRGTWRGEISGLAIYRRALSPDEVRSHWRQATSDGFASLAETPGLVALYPFDEGKGTIARNMVGEHQPLQLPEHFSSLLRTFLQTPSESDRKSNWYIQDLLRNTTAFVPLGLLMALLFALRTPTRSAFRVGLLATSMGAGLSFFIEIIQVFFPERSSYLADFLFNTLGTAIGVMLALFLLKQWRSRARTAPPAT